MTATFAAASLHIPLDQFPPLSAPVAEYHRALAAGAVPVDIRDQHDREHDGVILGALAISAATVLQRLTPGGEQSLRTATAGSQWLLISTDGHDAEWLAWHLQARGITGARFVVGGHRSMRRAGVNGAVAPAELAMFAAH